MDFLDMVIDCFGEADEMLDTAADLERPDLANVNDGGEFTFRGIKFVRLGLEQGGVLCITRQPITDAIQFNSSRDANYKNSNVRKVILEQFLPQLDGVDLLPFTMDLKPYDGEKLFGSVTDNAGILTYDLFCKYSNKIPNIRQTYWTCTPYSCREEQPYVLYVYSSGNVYGGYASYACRCRPACIFPI